MQQTLSEFKSMLTQASLQSGQPIPFSDEKLEQFYKEQCFQQILKYFETVLGFYQHNLAELDAEQMYENSERIREFFGIEITRKGEIENNLETNVPVSEKELDTFIKESHKNDIDKFSKAQQALEEKGLII